MIWLAVLLGFSMAAAAKNQTYRLPGDLKPISYSLDIVTNFDDFTYTGEVTIKILCINSTNTVVLHSSGLEIKGKPSLSGKGLSCNDCLEQSTDTKNDFLIFGLNEKLKSGSEYTLNIPFKGELKSTLAGYYRSRYLERDTNETKWLGVTQFEPSSARLAFPCFDEPEMKAKFTIRLGHEDKYSSISNMPLVKTSPMEETQGWVWNEFQESVPMSTYLVAWLVSEFKYGEAPTRPNGVKFRIWARPDALDQIQFASDVGPRVLEFFENLFDVEYPLPKQDMAAIPDFDAGAMENWGLITYRETRLLYDPTKPSIREKEAVAYVIAHELAHQWFGNLVTMKWWTDLWLNEGFATYVGTLGVQNVHPEFNFLNEASMGYLISVYGLDSLRSSHPISIKVGPPSEVGQIFDTISYKKGSTVIRMMHNFLGDSFKKGVTNYLRAHKFGNADQDDLWASLTDQAHKDGVLPQSMTVKEVMDSWTLQTGYPVLRVNRNYEDGTAFIEQHRFLSTNDAANDTSCWWFPLTYTSQSEANFENLYPKQWLKCGQGRVQLNNVTLSPNDWLIVNLKLTGLARVLYDAQNYEIIIKTLKSDQFATIDELNRAGLIWDTFDFAERGDLGYETALRMVSYISRETSYIPLDRGFSALMQLSSMLSRTPNYGIYKGFMQRILMPMYNANDDLFELPEDIQQEKIHIMLVKKFCKFGVGDCVKQAMTLFNDWQEANATIPFDLLSLVLCTAVKYGDESVWNGIYDRYLSSNLASEKATFLAVLGCSREVWVLNRYLQWSLNEEHGIRRQDSFFVFSYVANNDVGFHLAFDFLENNVKRIYDYNHPRVTKMGRLLLSLSGQIMYQHELDRLKKFVEDNAKYFESAKMAVQQSFERAALNIKWHRTHYENISGLLAR